MNWKTKFNEFLGNINLRVFRPYPRPFQKFNLMKKKNLIGAEIGVYRGENAYSLLKHSSIKKLYLIDPYEEYDENDAEELKEARESAENRLKDFNNIEWIYEYSEKAINKIPDNLDFVYIDGNHDYENSKRDIELYYPKLKAGGLLAGDDFTSYIDGDVDYDVFNAVIEFCREKKIRLFKAKDDWWFFKK